MNRDTDGLEPGRRRLPHLPLRTANGRTPMVYVTQVVAKRRPLLLRREAEAVIREAWTRAGHWRVGRYVLMPDHLHFFCSPGTMPPDSLKRWMGYWRSLVSRTWPWPEEKPVWQKDFFDRQLRHREGYAEKWHYVRENPVRAGWVQESEEWPWQGEMCALRWDG